MKKTFIPLFVGLLCWTGAQAAIIQVSVGDDLQAKINSATSGDEVRVHAGTFTGNFSFKNGVNVSGGWNDGFTAQTDYATILDANNSGRPVTSTGTLTNLTIWSNFKLTNGNPGDGGGGAHLRTNARLDHCLIEGNTTGGTNKAGGGAQLYNGGQLYNCIIRNNTATGDAGAIRINGSAGKVINCLIVNNTATNRCGGIQLETNADIIGNTIVGNDQNTSSDTDGDKSRCGLTCPGSDISEGYYLANNIIWGNKHRGTVNSAQIYYISRYPAAQRANNAVYNQDTGTGSIILSADDPGFVDKANGNYALVWNSLLVNKGANGYAQGDVDIAGNSRIADNTVDIGAYECPLVTGVAEVSVGNDLQQKINYTAVGSSVKVQAGTFTGNFTMKEGVDVSGGWNDGFTEQDGITILDGNASGRVLTQHAGFATETTWSNFILQNGNATGDGGGAQLHHNGVLSNCVITNNTASGNAGGVVMEKGGKVLNSKIISNNASTDAGGVRMKGDTNPGTLANCLVANNTATGKTGGISLEGYAHNVYNNTIVNNNQTSSDNASRCGVRLNVGAPLAFANNIIWGNKANGVVQNDQIELNSSYVETKASYFNNNAIVLSSEFGTNTLYLTEDPFMDAANGNYYLNIATAADLINSGNNDKAQGTTDLAGYGRKQGTIDRGCYEQTMYSRTVTEGNYGTICLPFAVEEGSFNGAKIYKVVSFADELQRGIVLEEVDAMEAGKPYFFLGEASTVKFRYVRAGDEAAAGNENGLYGTISGTTVSGQGKYVLQNNELRQTYNEATSSNIEINLDKNRAYLVFSEIPDAPAVAPVLSPRRRVIGVHQTPTGMETITNDQYTNKVIKDGRLIIIRDGKMYNALGQQL